MGFGRTGNRATFGMWRPLVLFMIMAKLRCWYAMAFKMADWLQQCPSIFPET